MSNSTAKKLGFWSIVLLTVNSIIGSGIFLSPGEVVKMAGTNTLIVYLCAAIFAAILAITFASASKYVSKGGAAYAYAKAAFGSNCGLFIGVTRFVAASIAWGVMATAVVKSTYKIFNIKPDFSNITIGFIVLMAILFLINIAGPSLFKLINNLSTIGKMAALFIVIIAGICIIIFTGVNNFDSISKIVDSKGNHLPLSLTTGEFVTATIAAFYAFTGFESVPSGAQDMEKPEKNLPKAIPLGILLIAVIYIGIVGSALFINPEGLVNTTQVVALVDVYTNPILRQIIFWGSLVSMFGINVAASFHTPRILESMAKEGQVPEFVAKRSKSDFPLFAFIVTIILAIIIPMAFSYDVGSIMIISSISRFLQFLVVPLGVVMYYYGKNKESINNDAKKNLFTDVIIPIISLILTILLLVKFNWVGQFTVKTDTGITPNYWAISAMVIGYLILPIILLIYNRNRKSGR